MGVIVTPKEEIDNYFDRDELSQSKLKLLLKGFDHFLSNQQEEKSLYYEEKDYLVTGSAVDCHLTGNPEDFKENFHISKLETKPSDAEMSIVNYVFDELVNNDVEIDMSLGEYPNMIQNSIIEHDWYKGKPGEKRTAGLIERCTPYFEDLKSALGKQVVSKEQNMQIDNIVMSLRTNPRTAKYFDRENQNRIPNMDFYYQLPIYFEYKGIACKALLDLLVVFKDENGKIIALQPIDLKTMHGNTFNFIFKVKQHRYDIQASWYSLALQHWMKNKGYEFNTYEIKNFEFVVESNSNVGTPLVYKINDNLLSIGRYGKDEAKVGETIIRKEIKGFETLVKEYQFYEDTDWKQDERLEKNPEFFNLSWNGIII